VRRQGRRVVTPDGHVWFVRRRRARRRPFWSGRRPERFHGEDELPAERLPEPGLLDLFTTRGYDVQHPTFDWRIENDETRLFNAVVIGAAAVAVTALLVWLAATYVLPWLVRWSPPTRGRWPASLPPWPCWPPSTSCTAPGMWSCSARGWPTRPGGCGVCRDGGAAVASWAS
jgi:hypothetical protein